MYEELAGAHQISGEQEKARDSYLKAARAREKALADAAVKTAAMYERAGGACYRAGNFPKALEYRLAELGVLEADGKADSRMAASACFWIASSLRELGDPGRALAYMRAAYRIQNDSGEGPSSRCCSILSEICRDLGDIPNALLYLSEALAIRERAVGAERPGTANLYGEMAELYRLAGEEEKAMAFDAKRIRAEETIKKLNR